MREKIEQSIKDLEDQLKKSQSVFSFLSGPVDVGEIKEQLLEKRLELAKLYRENKQIDEAIQEFTIVYQYLNAASYHAGLYISVLTQLSAGYEWKGDKEKYKTFLSELLVKLSLSAHLQHKFQMSCYLDDYRKAFSAEDTLTVIDAVLCNIKNPSGAVSRVYTHAINLKAEIFLQLERFEECYECLNLLAEYQYSRNRRINLSTEKLDAHLKAYSLARVKGYSVNEISKRIINDYYQKLSIDEEILFDSEVAGNKNELIKIALLFQHLKMTPPPWFPAYKVEKHQSQFLPGGRTELTTAPINLPPLSFAVQEEVQPVQEPAPIPEYIKIREKITLTWDKHGVAGYTKETQTIVEQLFIPRSLSPAQLEETELRLPRGGILYGPPGTGKTLIARTIAKDFIGEENVKVINGPEQISKYVGQSTENLRGILEEAHKNPNATYVVIIDEIEALVCSRDSSGEDLNRQIKADLTTTLLTYLDGVKAIDNLMVIGLTNYFDRLDDALIRPGRLDVHINIGLPKYEDRLAILGLYLGRLQNKNKVAASLDIEALAIKSEGLSGAGIKAFVDSTMKRFGITQLVSFDKGVLKIEETSNIEPLNDEQFLICLEDALKKNRRKKTEQELLQSRIFCCWNDRMQKSLSQLLEIESTFPYSSSLLVHVTGKSGTGTTSCSLNLFPKYSDRTVYIKAAALVNLSPKDQENYIDDCFYKAVDKQGVLIVDNLEDMSACNFNPITYMRDKLKMPLDEGETLKLVLVSKNEETVQRLFNGQITCDATIRVPVVTLKQEIAVLIQTLRLEIDIRETPVKLNVRLTITALKNQLITYCKKNPSAKRTLEGFLNYVNTPQAELKYASSEHRLFNKNQNNSPTIPPRRDDVALSP